MTLAEIRFSGHVHHMKRFPVIRFITAAVVAFSAVASVHAADKKKKKERPEPVVSTIAAINGNTVEVTTGSTTKSLKVTQFTEIRVNGQKGSAADLKPGMTVSEVALGADASVASRINASGSAVAVETPAPEKKKKSTKKKKKEAEEE
jgi:hypothetical protein